MPLYVGLPTTSFGSPLPFEQKPLLFLSVMGFFYRPTTKDFFRLAKRFWGESGRRRVYFMEKKWATGKLEKDNGFEANVHPLLDHRD